MLLIVIKSTASNLNNIFNNFIDDVVINKLNTIYTNDSRNVIKINKLVKFNDSSHFTKKLEHTSSTFNNTTRQNHNNYEHNVIQEINKHITHINNYGTEIQY